MISTVRGRIIVLCVVSVVTALMINASVNYLVVRHFMYESTDAALNQLADSHARDIAEWVVAHEQMISSLRKPISGPDPLAALKQVAAAGDFSAVYAGFADRTAISSNRPPTYDPTTRPWYALAAEAKGPVVIPPYLDVASGKLVVAFAVPVNGDDGSLQAVVSGDVAMDSVVANVVAIRPTPSSFGLLIDSRGRIVAHPDRSLTMTPLVNVIPELTEARVNRLDNEQRPLTVTIDGRTKKIVGREIRGTDWQLVVAVDEAEETDGLRSMLISSLIAVLVIGCLAAILTAFVSSVFLEKLSKVRNAMRDISQGDGDLTQRLPVSGRDEVAQIAEAFNVSIEKIRNVMLRVRDSSETVQSAANDIAGANTELSSRTEASAASLQETAASMDEITATVGQSADAARQASAEASAAMEVASRGVESLSAVVSTMRKIDEASARIASIIGVIDGIAFQTNILALNAAVEAARAGDEGRGFAVVAGEVRNLAQRSAEAAKEIKLLIESTVSAAASGSVEADAAGRTMQELLENVSRAATVIAHVTVAADEQRRGIVEINDAVSQLDEVVQRNAAMVEESTAFASELRHQAELLSKTVKEFKVDI